MDRRGARKKKWVWDLKLDIPAILRGIRLKKNGWQNVLREIQVKNRIASFWFVYT